MGRSTHNAVSPCAPSFVDYHHARREGRDGRLAQRCAFSVAIFARRPLHPYTPGVRREVPKAGAGPIDIPHASFNASSMTSNRVRTGLLCPPLFLGCLLLPACVTSTQDAAETTADAEEAITWPSFPPSLFRLLVTVKDNDKTALAGCWQGAHTRYPFLGAMVTDDARSSRCTARRCLSLLPSQRLDPRSV